MHVHVLPSDPKGIRILLRQSLCSICRSVTICIPVDRFKVSGAYHTLDSLRARFNETQSGDVRLLLFLSCHSTRPFQNPGEASVPLLKAVRREELAGRI